MISGKSSQKNFIAYFQTLYNNRINCASVITSTKFVTRSFNERDPMTGADGAKINFNCLDFSDRPAQNEEEEKLMKDVAAWLGSDGTKHAANALKSSIPGADLIELPLGSDHAALKAEFASTRGPAAERTFASAAPEPKAIAAAEPPSPKGKKVELTEEQAKALGIDF